MSPTKASRILTIALSFLRRAHEDEEGGSMVFGALTLFTLVLFTFLVYEIGMTSGDRIQLQGAADAAAYSGALVEAEALESIAFLNDGMSFVYYEALRYAVDAAVYGTLHAFERHDDWVREKKPERLVDTNEGPWDILEHDVALNNPGANDPSLTDGPYNYVPPVDPIHHGPREPERRDYSWVEMGSPGDLFRNRYEAALRHARDLVPRAKLWLQDMHDAERIILAATPALVEKTCARIALENGAEWVGVSDDLDQVFHLKRPGTGRDLAGFTDGGESEEQVDAAFANRYQVLENPVEKRARKVPSWFSALEGRSKGGEDAFGFAKAGFSQTRICWNERDWQHHPKIPGRADPQGHWHVAHQHHLEVWDDITKSWVPTGPPLGSAYDHDYGHGILVGPDAPPHKIWFQPDVPLPDDYRIRPLETGDPKAPHHAAQQCPTCGALGGEGPDGWTTVPHSQRDGEEFMRDETGRADLARVRFPEGRMPRPIRARGQLFRAGITVATWTRSRGVGRVLEGSPFGLVALASAQVGVREPSGGEWTVSVADSVSDEKVVFTNGRSVLLSAAEPKGDENAKENLFLGSGDAGQGMRFGARLVPIARSLTWADAAERHGVSREDVNAVCGSGLARLFYGTSPRGRWFHSAEGPGQDPPSDLAKSFSLMREALDLSGSADAFVH